VLLYFN